MSTDQQPQHTDGERWDRIAKQYAEWLEGEILPAFKVMNICKQHTIFQLASLYGSE
jgi:hypothetical protein